jgi:hypothetical protein
MSSPRLFAIAARPRYLLPLVALTLLSGLAMLPAMRTMADHGASLFSFESAGDASRSAEIVAGWGDAGVAAMWWQLALDLPFLFGYGLFAAGACTAVAIRAERVGRPRLRRAAIVLAWLGPIAAAADLLQDLALALVLTGRETQPWPRIGDLAGRPVGVLMGVALAFALVGAIVTRGGPR